MHIKSILNSILCHLQNQFIQTMRTINFRVFKIRISKWGIYVRQMRARLQERDVHKSVRGKSKRFK